MHYSSSRISPLLLLLVLFFIGTQSNITRKPIANGGICTYTISFKKTTRFPQFILDKQIFLNFSVLGNNKMIHQSNSHCKIHQSKRKNLKVKNGRFQWVQIMNFLCHFEWTQWRKSDLKQNPRLCLTRKLLCKHTEQRNDINQTEKVAHPSELVSDHQWRSAHYF